MDLSMLPFLANLTGTLRRGVVTDLLPAGEVRVELPGDPPVRVACDVLQTSSRPTLELKPGLVVLLALPEGDDGMGCILGSVGPYVAPDNVLARTTVEAGEELVLKCGPSSLTLTSEGKVLLKGIDVTTKAQRTHRIKGGSVHIN
jgi:hypothetical protein